MELLPSLLSGLKAVCATFPDPRQGRGGNIGRADFGLSAFAMFFLQSASQGRQKRRWPGKAPAMAMTQRRLLLLYFFAATATATATATAATATILGAKRPPQIRHAEIGHLGGGVQPRMDALAHQGVGLEVGHVRVPIVR